MPELTASTPETPRWQPLTGGSAIWIFMTVEVVTFGGFLLWHAATWRSQPEVFAAAQAHLDLGSGVLGTVLLLLGSWAAYQGVLSNARGYHQETAGWLLAASLGGVAFTVNKIWEWIPHWDEGLTLSSDAFWFTYFFLTQLHVMHVIPGVVILAVLAWRSAHGAYGPENALSVEAGAAYWHLVDVIWILLFTIVYAMHP
ncbi:MAG: cytochrome c oxidase subunit 3 [Alphaproteobacteria bacterium]|nr:cytochrome c oxidase subunit 3 [Alphaproteobacteria bacterium]